MPPQSPTKKARKAAKNGLARPPRRRDGDVLEAAVRVFYERGYSAAAVQDVADELGILKGSLYRLIGEAQKKKLVKNSDDPRLLANCVFATIIWTYQWFRPGRMARKAVVDVCVRQALHGVAG